MALEDMFEYKSFDYVKEYCKSIKVNERNNFRDDVCILVIGHLKYIEEMVQFYSSLKNVVFAVDEDEDDKKINLLKENKIEYFLAKKPTHQGYGNVNLQCSSSYQGAKYLLNKGFKYMIRMRSDQIIVQISELINKFNFTKVGFFSATKLSDGFGQPYKLDDYNLDLKVSLWNDYFLAISNKFFNNSKLTNNYLLDYCITGPISELLLMFDFVDDTCNHFHKSSLHGHFGCSHASAEHKIYLNYLVKKNMKLDNTIKQLKDNHFFLMDCLTSNKIDFLMIKQNYNNWSVAMPLQPDLYFSHLHGSY